MIINEDTWVLNEYQQWLNKVGVNLILVAAQRLVLTQCWWPLNLNPLHHSFCCVSLEQLQTLPPTRRWHAWDPPQLARSWLDFDLQFTILEPKISFELLPEMQSVFFPGGSEQLIWWWLSVFSVKAKDLMLMLMLMNQFSGSSAATLEAFQSRDVFVAADYSGSSMCLWWPLVTSVLSSSAL